MVSNYPRGTSTWNPIEHRLFAEISKNWAGEPLASYETILNYIRTTRTETGLTVSAALLDGETTLPASRSPASGWHSSPYGRTPVAPRGTRQFNRADPKKCEVIS